MMMILMERKSILGLRILKRHFGAKIRKPSYSPSSAQLSLDSYMRSTVSSRGSFENTSFSESWSLFLKSLRASYRQSSLSSRLFYGSFISLILFGDYLDRQWLEYRNPNGVYSFLAESPEDTIMSVCRTGDIIVFQRPILSFNPLNMIRTSLRQFACNGPYDHCGIIVHNEYDGDFPYCVEIDQNYRNRLRITPFDERILTSREPSIFVRQIHKATAHQQTMHKKFSDWIDCKINGFDETIHNKQYIEDIETFVSSHMRTIKRDSLLSLLRTLCFNGDNTVKIRSSIRDLTRKIRQLEYEISTQLKQTQNQSYQVQTGQRQMNMPMAVMDHKRHGRVRNVDQMIKETRVLKLQRILKKDNLQKRVNHIRQSMRINSSQFVGYFWRYLGVLEIDGAKPCEIRPQHFADSKIEIPMHGHTRLGHVQFVKTANESHKINDSQSRFRASKLNKWEQKETANK
eukprot:241452_1